MTEEEQEELQQALELRQAAEDLIAVAEEDLEEIRGRMAVKQMQLDKLLENKRFLKGEAPVVILYGHQNEPGNYLKLLKEIEETEGHLMGMEFERARTQEEIDEARSTLPGINAMIEALGGEPK